MHSLLMTGCALVLSASAFASHDDSFYRAYYLAHETDQLQEALDLFRGVAQSSEVSSEMREQATHFAAIVAEDIAAQDFATLLPPNTLAYAEVEQPGGRLGTLLDQLGLLQGTGYGADRFGISPLLLESLLGVDGAAVGVTGFSFFTGQPTGVAILHPGDMDLVRGLIETAIPLGGTPEQSIAGRDTWKIDGPAYVTLTNRLAIVSPDVNQISGVLDRLDGRVTDSFATNPALADTMALRGDDLMFFCLNARPVAPIAQGAIAMMAKDNPQLATAVKLADIGSLRAIAGRFGINDDGVGLDLNIQMAEGHKSVAFNFLRSAPLASGVFESIPEGAAFIASLGLNGPGAMSVGLRNDDGSPIVTMMDMGRELFANVIDVSVFGLAPFHGSAPSAIPEVGMVIRVNDPARSRELWNLGLTLATLMDPQGKHSVAAQHVKVAGFDVERYEVSGQALFFAADGNAMIVTPNENALARTLEGRDYGRSILDDDAFAPNLEHLADGKTSTFVASPARLIKMAEPFVPENERQEMGMVAALVGDAVVSVSTRHSNTNLGVGVRLYHIPDVSPFVRQLIDQELHGGVGQHPMASGSSGNRASLVSASPAQAALIKFHATEKTDVSRRSDLALEFCEASDDADQLDQLAWVLLADEATDVELSEAALAASERANDLSGYSNWSYLDTLAHAQFELGNVDEAIAVAERARSLAKYKDDIAEVEASLAEFRASQLALADSN